MQIDQAIERVEITFWGLKRGLHSQNFSVSPRRSHGQALTFRTRRRSSSRLFESTCVRAWHAKKTRARPLSFLSMTVSLLKCCVSLSLSVYVNFPKTQTKRASVITTHHIPWDWTKVSCPSRRSKTCFLQSSHRYECRFSWFWTDLK